MSVGEQRGRVLQCMENWIVDWILSGKILLRGKYEYAPSDVMDSRSIFYVTSRILPLSTAESGERAFSSFLKENMF